MHGVTTKITRVVLNQDRTVFSGSGIVYGFIVSSEAAANTAIVFRDSDDNIIFQVVVASVTRGVYWETPFVLDNGLKIDSAGSTNYQVAVFHDNSGE